MGLRSIYRDANWHSLQEKKEQGPIDIFVYQGDRGKISYSFVKRYAGKIGGVDYYDLVTCRGWGGPYVDYAEDGSENILVESFEKEFSNYCLDNHIIAEYVRFDPWVKNEVFFKGIYDIEQHGHLYCNDLSEDFFITQYHSGARNKIRSCIKNGVEVEIDENGNTIDTFLELYNYTINKHNCSDYYIFDNEYIQAYFSLLSGKSFIANAIFEGRIVASVLCLLGEDIAHYHYLGIDPAYPKLRANMLLTYKCADYAKAKGKSLFDMGGAGATGSVGEFKQQFVRNGQLYDCYIGKKIRDMNIYEELVVMTDTSQCKFFPKYRGQNERCD